MREPINRDCVGNIRNYRGVIWGGYIGNIWGVYRVYIRLYRDHEGFEDVTPTVENHMGGNGTRSGSSIKKK